MKVRTILGSDKVIMDKYPRCDFCDEDAHYEAKTNMGLWAYMCDSHYKEHGIGLGTGRGQIIIIDGGGRSSTSDKIPGGRAEGLPDSSFDKEDLEKGTRVEMEHTNDPEVATEIAKDHIEEYKDYYEALEAMENILKEGHHYAGTWSIPYNEEKARSLKEIITDLSTKDEVATSDLTSDLYDELGSDVLFDTIEGYGETIPAELARNLIVEYLHDIVGEYEDEPGLFMDKFTPESLQIINDLIAEHFDYMNRSGVDLNREEMQEVKEDIEEERDDTEGIIKVAPEEVRGEKSTASSLEEKFQPSKPADVFSPETTRGVGETPDAVERLKKHLDKGNSSNGR